MNTQQKPENSSPSKPLRLWPGIIIALLIIIIKFVIPIIVPGTTAFGVLGGLLGGLLIVIWWAFFSRASRTERWGAIVLMILSLLITSFLIDISIATGAQGMMYPLFAIPIVAVAFVAWAVASRHLSFHIRPWSMVATIILSSGFWTLLRIDGITGDFNLNLAWRWTETPEEQLLERASETPTISKPAVLRFSEVAEWPGFRGTNRNGIVKKVSISTDWSTTPPIELWRRSVGPGCSSFAVCGDYFFTQEQRGEEENITCYALKSGELVWMHHDDARFWDSHAGAGPRSTPTFSNGRIFTLGATGILNVLNARDGSVVWSRNAIEDANVKHSGWGYASSPLVLDSIVIVAAVGQLVAYDITTSEPRWFGPDGGDSYSSPHLMTIDGIDQILLLNAAGAISVNPANGTVIWEYTWPGESRIVQPALTGDGKLLICNGDGTGLRCIDILHESGEWRFEERWTSTQVKPNFNDFVVHNGYVYGYNGPMLVCIDAENGERMWRSGRYGGQIILLSDQNLIVVLTEKGEIALVRATPDKYDEVARLEAIEGKTWNHPVLAGGILLVRNTQEMAAFKLAAEGS